MKIFIARKLVYAMLEKNPDNRISLTNILTHRFIIKHYADENKSEKNKETYTGMILEENKSQTSLSTNKNNEKSMEERKNRKKNWKKSLTHQNDATLTYNDTEWGVETDKIHNDLNPKFKQKMQHKSAKSFNGNGNLMPPIKEIFYQKFSQNKMLGSIMNDSNFLDALENHEQFKAVNFFSLS